MEFDVKIDLLNKQFEFLIENKWKNCNMSEIKKTIKAPIECNSTDYDIEFENLGNIFNTDNLNETITQMTIKYMTNYSFEVMVTKNFSSSIQFVNKTIFLETGFFL